MKLAKFRSLQSVVVVACLWAVGASTSAFAAAASEVAKSGVVGSIENPLGDRFAMFDRITAQQTRVIFYRPVTQAQLGAATIYVNGYYHTSLIPGGYTELCMAPNKAELGVRIVENGRNPRDSLDTITAINLMAGQTTFMRLREPGYARAVLQPVAAATAQPELQTTRLQVHTISRLPDALECIDGGPAPAPAPVVAPVAVNVKPQQINLAADALFAFSKSDKNSMTLTGRQSLDNLISKIKGEYITIDRINVIGHADPLGIEALNMRLASDRAITVRDYLLTNGLQNTRVTGEGRGSREPVVTSCSRVINPVSVLCNQPNRRVVVEISGARR
jgi:OOP family OmpA-OmpF porin